VIDAGEACIDWFEENNGEDCPLCHPIEGKHRKECPLSGTEKPHPRRCGCDECQGALGDYLRDQQKDSQW
jgi:hypothetical protein